jgi:prepilin-type N-terminal cleavage/methylation domain-containing protein/prepilin-type processing-associated H-X9-DG protein
MKAGWNDGRNGRQRGTGGFTLLELLVVIGIISVLAGLLLPALLAAKGKAQGIHCTSNFKQFGLAFQLYAGDHNDSILPNRDGPQVPLGETWVEGWLGLPGPDCTNTQYLTRSLVAPYLASAEMWRCPVRRNPVVGETAMPRVRTVSMNGFLGAPVCPTGMESYHRLSDIVRPAPSDMIVFMEERIDTINDGTFAMQWDFDERQPTGWILRDKPGIVHRGGCNLSHADGHVELRRWRDPRTVRAPRDDAPMPANEDVLWMQSHGTWRARSSAIPPDNR